MEAAGHSITGYLGEELEKKFDRVAEYVMSATNLTMEDDWQPQVQANNKCSKVNESEPLMTQTLSMVEFMKNKSRERSKKVPTVHSQSAQVNNVGLTESNMGQASGKGLGADLSMADLYKLKSQKQPSPDPPAESQQKQRKNEQQHTLKSKFSGSGQKQKQPAIFIKPGSIGAYNIVRKMQMNTHADDFDREDLSNGTSVVQTVSHVNVVSNEEDPVTDQHEAVADQETTVENPTLVMVNVRSWKFVRTKDQIWEHVLTKFNVKEAAKKFVLTTVNDIWRSHKNRLKTATYKFESKEERLANRPQNIPDIQYKELLDYWELDEIKEKSRKNRENVKKRVDYHTMGPLSYAMKKVEMEENHPNNKKPSMAELYIESRKRVLGHTYKTDPKPALQNIEKMKKGDSYHDVITKEEHSGRLCLAGRTVTKKTLKESGGNAPYVLPSKYMDSIEKHLEQKITARILSKLKEANSRINIKITPGDDEVGGSDEASDSIAYHSDERV